MLFKKNVSATFMFILLLLLTACGNSASQSYDEAAAESMPMAAELSMEMEESGGALAYRADSSADSFANSTQQNAPQTRLIIRTADMGIVVTDTEMAIDTIARMIEDNGGWVVQSSIYQYSDAAKRGNMSVRVPSEGFQSALDAITELSVEVNSISTSGQDVTEEYVDVAARLANLEATADRVRAFLDETKNVEEALAVNQELSRLEGDIEAMKGRKQYLEQSAAFSTINIDLTPDALAQPIEVGGWQPQGVVKSAIESLINALQSLVDILIWLIIFVLPIVLIIGIPLWLIIRAIRRRRARRKAEHVEVVETAAAEMEKDE
ncbi:MAG: DUF4349 domain-containing protein [Anaerolineales bacterium]|nr:DUF4349 domain-containing protein [Anaerolineales bacterium]